VPVPGRSPNEDTAAVENLAFANSVREELARILRSPIFSKAPSLSRFLSYIVQQKLAGDPSPRNEYTLGVDVFDRGDSFDPAADTIVRVQARRLRSKIEKYYASEGQADPIVIDLPKGQYAPVFRAVPAGPHEAMPRLVYDSSAIGGRIGEQPQLSAGLAPSLPLPAPCTSFVGRDKELADVKQLVRSDHIRLLTLTGTGGSGKTRLALHVAADLSEEFPGGVYMVALASVTDSGTVASIIAQTLGHRHTGGRPLTEALQLYLSLSVHAPTLLLLDNFEQVVAAAPLLVSLLASCPPLKICVTSRAVLHVSGEHEYLVPLLRAPDPRQLLPLAELSRNPAVALYVQRATAVNPAFTIKQDNARAVAEICSQLDGLPLAIELAAARVKILPPSTMAARLGNSLDLLTCGHRDLPARQQTLRRTIDWSYGLLSAAEQVLFRRLAIFAGGCTLESAEAVCNARRDLEIGVVDGISSLVDKNLLQRNEQESDEVRFIMLQTIREYALEKLAACGELEFTRRAHAAYCIVIAEQGAAQMAEAERTNWLALWDAEHDNLRDALDWLIETDSGTWALRLGTALFAFWERREYLAEGRQRLEAVLNLKTAASATRERARAAWYAAIFADQQGDFPTAIRLNRDSLHIYRELGDRQGIAAQLGYIGQELQRAGNVVEARPLLEQSLAICRELGDNTATASALSNLAELVAGLCEYALARSLLEEALSIFQEIGNGSGVGWSLNHLGDLAFDQRNFAEAFRYYHEGFDAFQVIGDRWGIARSFADLGRLASEQNDQGGARSLFEQALRGFMELGHTRGVAKVLEGLAGVAVREGKLDCALTLGAAAEGLRQRVGAPKRPVERALLDRVLQPAWREGDPSIATAIWADGLRMPLDQAIRYALDWPAPHAISVRS
jgi:predicted ATPase